jgi:transcription termination factor Rho
MSARPRKRGRRGGGGGGQRQEGPSVTKEKLQEKTMPELKEMADELDLDVKGLRKKEDMVQAVYDAKVRAEGFIEVDGVLDILPEGYGFLRTNGYLPGDKDVYCSMSQIRRFELRRGDLVSGQVRPPKDSEKYPALLRVDAINNKNPEDARGRRKFGELTPVHPDERLRLEHGPETLTARIIDLVAPIGKGQRGLIVSPPKAGKTTILKDIANAISANNPECVLLCLLVDERPEEVTEMERSIDGDVISSTFDMPSENHIAVAELTLERAKRLVESGFDVVILLDSITRLARAYNLATPASGRILSGGVDSTALYPPKRFFGAARNIEHGGSMTILATALVETGSKMDEVIFEEFKGTGNMELRLDRGYADKRIFPAIEVVTSGTRKEELILDPIEAPFVWGLRRLLHGVDSGERAIEMLIKGLKQTESNEEFLRKMSKRAQSAVQTGETV